MKFAVNYLFQFIDQLSIDLATIKEQLINLGIEVESVSKDQFGNDILEVAVPPNRADLLSIIGIAKELAVVNGCKVRFPETGNSFKSKFGNNSSHATDLKINVIARDACPKYLGVIIRKIKQDVITPEWIANVLNQAGMKLISPIVDITNYVMFELGQPLHAFDLHKINREITVRYALRDESIILLNDQKVNLTEEDLIIADNSAPLAIAGIMGGVESKINASTNNILLECAYFEPIGIRMSSKRHNIISDASQRFSRNIDYNLAELAINRCCELILDLVGGEIVDYFACIEDKYLPVKFQIDLFYAHIKKVLGIEIPAPRVITILQSLGARIIELTGGLKVEVPTWRTDLKIPEDLIEELAKHIGYKNITPAMSFTGLDFKLPANSSLDFYQELQFKYCLANRGYYEVINYSFIEPDLAARFYGEDQFYELKNPISRNMRIMRPGLWPGLINNLIYNKNRQIARVRLFEVGTVFNKDLINNSSINESIKIAGLINQNLLLENWQKINHEVDFFALKNDVIALMRLKNCNNFTFHHQVHLGLHPERSAQIRINNLPVGFIGALHPALSLQLSIEGPVYLFELDLSLLLNSASPKFTHISKFPAIRRDFSILVDLNIQAVELENIIRLTLGDLLQELVFFDVFAGKQLPAHKKSIAFGIFLQHPERTLIEEEINQLVQKLLINLQILGELRS